MAVQKAIEMYQGLPEEAKTKLAVKRKDPEFRNLVARIIHDSVSYGHATIDDKKKLEQTIRECIGEVKSNYPITNPEVARIFSRHPFGVRAEEDPITALVHLQLVPKALLPEAGELLKLHRVGQALRTRLLPQSKAMQATRESRKEYSADFRYNPIDVSITNLKLLAQKDPRNRELMAYLGSPFEKIWNKPLPKMYGFGSKIKFNRDVFMRHRKQLSPARHTWESRVKKQGHIIRP